MRAPGWLGRNLAVLTAVSLMQDAASELAYPLLPLFLTATLGAAPVLVGLIEGVAQATAGITQYLAGRFSDRTRRKPWVAWGYGLAAAGKVIVAAAFTWPVVLMGRVTDRFGKGIRSAPRDALIADSVPAGSLGRAFGFHRTGDTIGAVIGPLLGLVALQVFADDLRTALWVAAVPAVAAVLLVALVREPRRTVRTVPPTPAPPVDEVAQDAASSRRSPLPRSFWRVAGVLTVIAVVNFPDALILLRISELGWSPTGVVLAYVVFNISYAALSYPAGAVADRFGPAVVYGFGLLFFAVGYLGLALVDGGPTVIVLLALYGAFPALTDGVGKAWIASLAPSQLRGRAMGVFQGLNSGAILLAGLWAGLLWTSGSGSGVVPLAVSGTLGALAGLALLLTSRVSRGSAPT